MTTPWRVHLSIRHANSPLAPGRSPSSELLRALEALLPGVLSAWEPKEDPYTHPQAISRVVPCALP